MKHFYINLFENYVERDDIRTKTNCHHNNLCTSTDFFNGDERNDVSRDNTKGLSDGY